ncbi:hypothetical protein Tco_0329272 [Tanacetum coccineum]
MFPLVDTPIPKAINSIQSKDELMKAQGKRGNYPSYWQRGHNFHPRSKFEVNTSNFNHMTANRIDVIDMASEVYRKEILEVETQKTSYPILNSFLEDDNQVTCLIAKELSLGRKAIDQVQHQRRVNPKIPHDVSRKKLKKLLDAGLILPKSLFTIAPWVSRIHCVPKKVDLPCSNEENELIQLDWLPAPGTFPKVVCWPSFTTMLKRTMKSSWITSRSLGIPLKLLSRLEKMLQDVKTPIVAYGPSASSILCQKDAKEDCSDGSPPPRILTLKFLTQKERELAVRSSVPIRKPDCPDCEGSRVLGFVYSITRASNPQLHFGNPDIPYLSTYTFYHLAIS